MLPDDVDPVSRCRLPPPRREDLPPAAQAMYDQATDPKGGTIRGLRGPAGIHLHAPRLAEAARPVNRYLRFEAGFTPREREVAILATARACDSAFEWAAHEPEALRVGVPRETIEAIKHEAPLDGAPEEDALIVRLAREAFARKVSQETYAAALARFGRERLVALSALMGAYAATAVTLTVFDMQLDDDAPLLPPRSPRAEV